MMLETFDNKRTKWLGLWYNSEYHSYSSAAINLASLKQFKGNVRFVVRKNRFYEKDTNRPNMQIMITDSHSDCEGKPIELEDGERYIRLQDAIEIARSCIDDAFCGYSNDDLQVEVACFMEEKAIEI